LVLDAERRETMSQFARERFREVLAWENSEQRLIAFYRQLFDRGFSRSTVKTPQQPVAANDRGA
jgi:SOS response regulatory protein OraA/RecX